MTDINNREHDRFNFPPGSWVQIVLKGLSAENFKMYQLIDISQSGMSFKSHNKLEFKRGMEFFVIEVGGNTFKEPLMAKVRYVKNIDEFGIDLKVGAEFLVKL